MGKTRIVVRGFHCDAYGHVNNARYLEFLEESRWDFLQPAVEDQFFENLDLIFVIVNININYRKPLVPNMPIEVGVSGVQFSNSKIVLTQVIVDASNGAECSNADVSFVLLDKKSGKPTAISAEIKAKFEHLHQLNNV